MSDIKTLDFTFIFTAYIETNASIGFFNDIFGGNCPDWNDKSKIYNHFYQKFKENKCSGELFFTALDRGNRIKMLLHFVRDNDIIHFISADEVDDMLRRFYTWFPEEMNNKIWNNLDIIGKNEVLKIFNEKCYPSD